MRGCMNQDLFEVNTAEALTHFFLSIVGDGFDVKKFKIAKQNKPHKFDTAIYIGIYGNIEGMMLIETKKKTAMEFAHSLPGMEGQEVTINEIVKNFIGEMGNVLMNKTVPLLNKSFGDSYLSTPSVFIGANIQVNLFYKISYSVIVCTQFGEFKITFAIKE